MISVQLSESDYFAAQRLHSKWSRRQWIVAAAVVFPPLCIGIAAWAGAFSTALQTFGFFLVIWVVAGSIGVLLGRLVGAPIKWRRAFAAHKLLQNPVTYSWDSDRFTAKSEYGNSSIPWSNFLKFRENEQTLLLYVSKMQFFCIPKHAFPSEAASHEFSSLLRQRVVA
jgi:hypothetical protein